MNISVPATETFFNRNIRCALSVQIVLVFYICRVQSKTVVAGTGSLFFTVEVKIV